MAGVWSSRNGRRWGSGRVPQAVRSPQAEAQVGRVPEIDTELLTWCGHRLLRCTECSCIYSLFGSSDPFWKAGRASVHISPTVQRRPRFTKALDICLLSWYVTARTGGWGSLPGPRPRGPSKHRSVLGCLLRALGQAFLLSLSASR